MMFEVILISSITAIIGIITAVIKMRRKSSCESDCCDCSLNMTEDVEPEYKI